MLGVVREDRGMLLRSTAVILFAIAARLTAGGIEDTVLPILKSNCVPCHDDRSRTSGFSVTTLDSVVAGGSRRGPSVRPGDPAKSPLIQLLRGELTPRMPLGKTLPESDIATIERWIGELKPEP